MYSIKYSKLSLKDKEKLKGTSLYAKAQELISIIKNNPFQNPPPYEKLVGDLAGMYSRRINRQHRIWYDVNVKEKTVRILRMWSHYE